MDPVLARMFDLDRPLAVRMAERDLQEDFVKSASQVGIDLTKLADDEVDQLWRYHKGYRTLQAEMMAKEAAWVRMGRHLAHRYIDQMAKLGMTKRALFDPTDVPVPHLEGMLGDPSLAPRLKAQPLQVASLVEQGLPADVAKQWAAQTYGANTPMTNALNAKFDEAWKAGQDVYLRKYQAGPPRTPLSRRALVQEAMTGGIGTAPPAPTGIWAKYGPGGLMKAVSEGNWGTALRKGLPIAGLGVGAMMLMRRKAEQERERQLALGSMASAPGAVPMAAYPRMGP